MTLQEIRLTDQLHMGATWTHIVGAPIVFYISPYESAGSLSEVLTGQSLCVPSAVSAATGMADARTELAQVT